MRDIILSILLSGAGAGLIILIIGRLVPNKNLAKWGEGIGVSISTTLGKKWGKGFYEPLENFIQNSAGVFFGGLKRGLDKDDKK